MQWEKKAGERNGEQWEDVLRFESSERMIHKNIWGRAFQQKKSQVQRNWNIPDCSKASKEVTMTRVQ